MSAKNVLIKNSGETYSFFVRPSIDDFPLTVKAFRVYCHLMNQHGRWSSYQQIADKCFACDHRSHVIRLKYAIDAIQELASKNLISIELALDCENNAELTVLSGR